MILWWLSDVSMQDKAIQYAIDEFGTLTLHSRIEELQTSDHNVTVVEVKEIVDEAIARSNKMSVSYIFDVLFKRRFNEEDMVILGEKDFSRY